MPARSCQQRGLERPTDYPRSLVLLPGALDGLFRQHRLRQSDVARRLEVDPANVSAWCVGKRPLPSYWLEPLARVLGISLAELVRACWTDYRSDGLQRDSAPDAVPEPPAPQRGTGGSSRGLDEPRHGAGQTAAAPLGDGHAAPVDTTTAARGEASPGRPRIVLYSAELPWVPYRPQPRPLVGCLRCRRTWYAGRQFATHACLAATREGSVS